MIGFSSRDIKCKQPFGAAEAGSKIKISFPVSVCENITEIIMIIRRIDNHEVMKINLKRGKVSNGTICFNTTFVIEKASVYYYRFEVFKDDKTKHFVGNDGFGNSIYGDWLPEWQLSIFGAGFSSPDWAKGKVVYQIFADRFCRVEDGKKPLQGYLKSKYDDVVICDDDGVFRANDFYGGNIKGIISRLDYLQDLGVGIIYLTPIFKSSSNHRYDTGDYFMIDPLFGTEAELKDLIDKASEKNIYIVLDGVFNHTGADSKYFNKFNHYDSIGAYQSKESPYFSWYNFTKFPDAYACWWGVTVVPTINRECEKFQEMIAGDGGVIEKWTKMGVKGWRLDVADELSSKFLEKIRTCLKKLDKNAVLIGEVWEDASTKVAYSEQRSYFFGKQLDGVMNYPFKTAILNYVKGGDALNFTKAVMNIIENYPRFCLDCSMTLIGSHDTERAINHLSQTAEVLTQKDKRLHYSLTYSQYNNAKKLLKLAVALQFFLPGLPTIYYGDEIGMQGYEDPINRRFLSEICDNDLLSYYKKLSAFRNENASIFLKNINISCNGNLLILDYTNLKILVNNTQNSIATEKVYDLFSGAYTSKVDTFIVVLGS